MAPLDLLVIILPIAVGVFFSAGFGIPALVPATRARPSFFVGGVLAWLLAVLGGYLLSAPLWQRLLITGAFGAITAAGTAEAIRWARPKDEPAASTSQHADRLPDPQLAPNPPAEVLPDKPPRPAPVVTFADGVRGQVDFSVQAQIIADKAPNLVAAYGTAANMQEQLMIFLEGAVRDEMIKYPFEEARKERSQISTNVLLATRSVIEHRFFTVLHGITLGEIHKLSN